MMELPKMLLPETMGFRFEVYRVTKKMSSRGRAVRGDDIYLGGILGVLAETRAEEKERWKELTHPVSHKIIQLGSLDFAEFTVLPGDYFLFEGRKFFVSTMPNDLGFLHHGVIYYCGERCDVS